VGQESTKHTTTTVETLETVLCRTNTISPHHPTIRAGKAGTNTCSTKRKSKISSPTSKTKSKEMQSRPFPAKKYRPI